MSIRDYIEDLRSKPTHVRQSIALGVSAGITSLVFVGWAVALVSSDQLVFTSSETGAVSALADATKETPGTFSNLLGAAGAFQGSLSGESSIRAVETNSSSTLDTKTVPEETTVIPF